MSGKFRRMIIIMLISISMILLVSCGTMEVSTNVKVNKDGSSNTVFRLVYDESIKKVVGDGLLQQVLGTETEINVYSQDNNTVEEATIITPQIDIKDLLKSNSINKIPSAKMPPCVRNDTCATNDCKSFINTSLGTRTGKIRSGKKYKNKTIPIGVYLQYKYYT